MSIRSHHFARTDALSQATAPVVEHLEQRRLLAADIVNIDWHGQTMEARAGEGSSA